MEYLVLLIPFKIISFFNEHRKGLLFGDLEMQAHQRLLEWMIKFILPSVVQNLLMHKMKVSGQ
jgi:hypothetical protein